MSLFDREIRDEYPEFHEAKFYSHIINDIKTYIANNRGNHKGENYQKNKILDLLKCKRDSPQNPNSSTGSRISKDTPPWRIDDEWDLSLANGRRKEDKYYFLKRFNDYNDISYILYILIYSYDPISNTIFENHKV